MQTKNSRLNVLIDPELKRSFEQQCAEDDITPSQMVRQMIREHLRRRTEDGRVAEQEADGKLSDAQ